jgi:hypothetical protein
MKRFTSVFKKPSKDGDEKDAWKKKQTKELEKDSSSNNLKGSSSANNAPQPALKRHKLPAEDIINMKFEKLLVCNEWNIYHMVV